MYFADSGRTPSTRPSGAELDYSRSIPRRLARSEPSALSAAAGQCSLCSERRLNTPRAAAKFSSCCRSSSCRIRSAVVAGYSLRRRFHAGTSSWDGLKIGRWLVSRVLHWSQVFLWGTASCAKWLRFGRKPIMVIT